jgi:hypothetical protein
MVYIHRVQSATSDLTSSTLDLAYVRPALRFGIPSGQKPAWTKKAPPTGDFLRQLVRQASPNLTNVPFRSLHLFFHCPPSRILVGRRSSSASREERTRLAGPAPDLGWPASSATGTNISLGVPPGPLMPPVTHRAVSNLGSHLELEIPSRTIRLIIEVRRPQSGLDHRDHKSQPRTSGQCGFIHLMYRTSTNV